MYIEDDYMNDFENNLNANKNENYNSNINFAFNNLNNNNFQVQTGINNNINKHYKPNDYHQEKNILYISDLPYNTNETDIKLFFKRYGDSISLITINQKFQNDTRPISAKVIFKDFFTANQARIEMNLRKLKGHAIRLMWEERDNSIRYNSTTNLFVKGIPFNVQPREVYEYFMKFGDISSAKLKDDQDGNHLGYGYVTYYSPESAENAIKFTNGKIMWGGGPLQIDYFKKKNERLTISGPEVFKLYITNFPGDFTENNIVELTKEFGPILSCTIKTERIGRRYALVCYENEEAANRAKSSLEGKNVYGYNLYCKIITNKAYPDETQLDKNKNKINITNKRFVQKNIPGFINNKCNLYIKNIPYMIKEKEFYEIFSKYGKITSAKLETYNLISNIGDKTVSTPTSKGYGYVCYEDQETASKVKDLLNGQYLPGYEHWKNPLTIEYFLTKSQKEINNMNNENSKYLENRTNMQNPYFRNNYQKPVLTFDLNIYNSKMNNDEKIEYLGEIIYDQIDNSPLINRGPEKDKIVGKITGMILAIGDMDKIINVCNDNNALNEYVNEGLNLLSKENYDYNSE